MDDSFLHNFEITWGDSCWLEERKKNRNDMVKIHRIWKIMKHEINGEKLSKILESKSAENGLTHQWAQSYFYGNELITANFF